MRQHEIVDRIDVGPDCVLVYRCGQWTSLVVTTRDNGDAEVLLSRENCRNVIRALEESMKREVDDSQLQLPGEEDS